MFDLAGLEEAQRIVARAMPPTPQYRWPGLCRRAGCEVWVKHENHTRKRDQPNTLSRLARAFRDGWRLEAVPETVVDEVLTRVAAILE